jgi:hypothetical protein
MTYEEYQEKLKALVEDFNQSKSQLMKQFVIANNPYKPGDKVTDHNGTILIEKMGFACGYSGDAPCATYDGVELNKDGTPNKKGKKRRVWQSNLI